MTPSGRVKALHGFGQAFEALERDVDTVDGPGDVDIGVLASDASFLFSAT
jgi:hypothetical protein